MKLFLYREKEANDRDCCAYVERPKFECGHYFGHIGIHGACYLSSLKAEYSDIDTILTEEEYNKLFEYNKIVDELGYGIEKDSEKYKQGMKAIEELKPIFDKLISEEAEKFFAEIITDEKQYVMDEYDLTEDEVDEVFANYGQEYQDRGIVGYVWRNCEDLGAEYIESCYQIPDFLEYYIDYDKFGNDLVQNDYDRYYKLADGRIVEMSY